MVAGRGLRACSPPPPSLSLGESVLPQDINTPDSDRPAGGRCGPCGQRAGPSRWGRGWRKGLGDEVMGGGGWVSRVVGWEVGGGDRGGEEDGRGGLGGGGDEQGFEHSSKRSGFEHSSKRSGFEHSSKRSGFGSV
jgi:hypothetical protein